MTKEPDRDRCGIGRCNDEPNVIGNGVPMCHHHWLTCCATGMDTPDWLRQKARSEWKSAIVDTRDKKPARRKAKPTQEEPRTTSALRRRFQRTGRKATRVD